MIAPIRETSEPTARLRPTEGVRRARRWIVRTLLIERPTDRGPNDAAQRAWIATLWIVLVAAAYLAHLFETTM